MNIVLAPPRSIDPSWLLAAHGLSASMASLSLLRTAAGAALAELFEFKVFHHLVSYKCFAVS